MTNDMDKGHDYTGAVLADVYAERRRAVGKGYTFEKDDARTPGVLALAAAHYALAGTKYTIRNPAPFDINRQLYRRAALVRAAGLIVAEIERMDRLIVPT